VYIQSNVRQSADRKNSQRCSIGKVPNGSRRMRRLSESVRGRSCYDTLHPLSKTVVVRPSWARPNSTPALPKAGTCVVHRAFGSGTLVGTIGYGTRDIRQRTIPWVLQFSNEEGLHPDYRTIRHGSDLLRTGCATRTVYTKLLVSLLTI